MNRTNKYIDKFSEKFEFSDSPVKQKDGEMVVSKTTVIGVVPKTYHAELIVGLFCEDNTRDTSDLVYDTNVEESDKLLYSNDLMAWILSVLNIGASSSIEIKFYNSGKWEAVKKESRLMSLENDQFRFYLAPRVEQ